MAADGSLRFDTKIDTSDFDESISTLEKALDRLTDAVDKLSDNIVHGFHSSGAAAASAAENVDSIGESAKESEAQVRSLKEQMDAISVQHWEDNTSDAAQSALVSVAVDESAMNYDPSAMAAVFGEAAAEIHNYAEAVEEFGNQAGAVLNQTSQEAKRAGEEFAEAAEAAEESAQETESSCGGVMEFVINAFEYALEVFKQIPAAVARGLSKIPGIVKNALSKAASAASNFGKVLGSGISNGVKSAVAKIKSIVKPADKATKSILKLSNMFKLMVIRMAMRAAIQGVKDGMQNLVQYSASANQAMSSLMSGMTYLKNSFATAFAPILTYVVPVLNTLINVLATALSYINQFFAALGGAATFVKAKKVNEDYAKSLKSTGSAAKSAGKDAKKALAPFDDLTVLQENASSDSSSGSSADPSQMFETAAIDSAVKTMADKIKSLFRTEDWSGLGAYLADGINAGLQKVYDAINWDTVGPKITYFVNAFTETFNSLVDNLNWDLLGRTIGAGVNTVVNTLNLLIEGIDWQNLGKKIGEGMNGLVDEVDWTALGNLFGNKFMIFPNTLLGFVREFDWGAFGTSIGEGINGAVNKIDPTVLAQGGSGLVKGLLDSISNAMIETDWQTIGNKIAKFFATIDYSGIATSLFYGIGVALASLAEFLWGLIEDAWRSVMGWWRDNAYEDGQFTMQGLIDGINEAWANIKSWVKNNIVDPLLKGLRDAFGIHSPSTVMAEMGKYLMEGLKNGITNFIPSVITKFSELKQKISGKWDEVKTETASKWSAIKSDLSNSWDGLKQDAGTAFDNIRDKISEAWRDVKNNSSELWGKGGITGVITGSINGIISAVESMVNSVVRAINGLIGGINKLSFDIPATPFSDAFTLGFDIPNLREIHLPRLASGTVVPPRAGEFAAILGDNKRETEVVSPLSTIKQALLEALRDAGALESGDIHLTLNLDGRVIYDDIVKRNRMTRNQTGKNPLLV